MDEELSELVAIVMFVAAVLISAVVYSFRTDEKRRQRLRALAGQYGWQLAEEPGRRKACDLVAGRHRGRDFLAFQFGHARVNKQSGATRHFVRVSVLLPGPAPRTEINPRGVAGTTTGASGGPAFRLGAPAFDELFTVRADDEAFARSLLRSGLATWLAGQAYARPLIVDGAELRTWARGKLEAETLPPLLDYLCTAMDQVPVQVWPTPRPR